MGSFRHPQPSFQSYELDALDFALAGALAMAKELGIKRRGLSGAMRRRIFVIAREGITDPTMLRDKLLKSFNLDKIAN